MRLSGRKISQDSNTAYSGNEIYVCAECLEGIIEGESFLEVDCSHYHKDCLENKSFDDLIEIFGYESNKAVLRF